jgi:hypothetical protein
MMLDELPAAVADKIVTVDADKAPAVAMDSQNGATKAQQCWSLGPFADARQADRAMTQLTGRNIKGRTSQRTSRERIGYRVRLPVSASKRAGQALVRELGSKGVRDIALVSTDGQFIVALGFFKHETSAQKRIRRIRALGYKPVMDELTRDKQGYWIDLYPGTNQRDLDKVWPELSRTFSGIRREARQCP